MSKQCETCGKGSLMVGKRVALRATRYNPTSKSRKYPNLHRVISNSGKKIEICMKCLKKNRHLEPS